MGLAFPLAAARYERFRAEVWARATALVRAGNPRGGDGEKEVQARWFGGEYGQVFEGTEGERLEISQFGHWNHGAGPDFTDAALFVDGQLRRGSIEVDLDVRNWEDHGHGGNPSFNGTVLHVFTDQPALRRVFTKTEENSKVPQLLLPQHCGLEGPPDFLPEAFPGRCLAPLARMEDGEIASLLAAAAQYRLRRKAERLRIMGAATSPLQAAYQATAEALGYRGNKTAMAILAQRCPLRELLTLSSLDREARLFGCAGFLDEAKWEWTGQTSGDYRQILRRRWLNLAGGHTPNSRRAIPWRYDGFRPLNHPQRRLAALAQLLRQWDGWRHLWEEAVNNLELHVNNWSGMLAHPYWNRHHSLGSKTFPKGIRLLGRDRLRDLLGNVVFPSSIREFPDRWGQYVRLRGGNGNTKLRRATLRLFGESKERAKLFTRYYHQQQGLLQIFEDFCLEDASACRNCPFPEQLLQWRHVAPDEKTFVS